MKDQTCYDDRAMITDALDSQKMIAQAYNHYAGECSTQQRKDKLMQLLGEEHDMQFEVFSEMNKRGWYCPEEADRQKVSDACQQFTQKKKNL